MRKMIELKGKFADAHIFADIVDEDTYSQIIKVINNPVAKDSYLAIMADCHAGAGCVIGTTMQIKDRVCPNLVGVDIGCGMLTVKLGKLNFDEEDFKRFDDACHNVPSGFCIYKQILAPEICREYLYYRSIKGLSETFFSIITIQSHFCITINNHATLCNTNLIIAHVKSNLRNLISLHIKKL